MSINTIGRERWPEWVKKVVGDRECIEIKTEKDRYYAYWSTSKWDKSKKQSDKVTKYLGVVTPKGIFKPRISPVPKGIYEYGDVALLYSLSSPLIELLKKHFPYQWKRIICFSILRLIQPLPIKIIKSHYEKTYLSVLLPDLKLSPKSISRLIKDIGDDHISRTMLMHSLRRKGGYALFDLSAILSRSKNNHWLEYGHNKDELYIPQVNIGIFYSLKSNLPTYIKMLPGSVRDVTSLANAVEESTIRNVILVLDRGFYSTKNLDYLKEKKKKRNLDFMIPLKRNSKKINYGIKEWDGFLFYRKRHIKYYSYMSGEYRVHVFEDAKLKYNEERNFYSLVEQGKKTLEELKDTQKKFGKIAILTSNKKLSSEDVYLIFKKKEAVEYCFNVFKNLLEADRSYLGSKEMLDGYMFLNFLSLYIYYLVLNKNKEKELMKRYSVRDILLELSKVYVIRYEKVEIISEIPKKVRDIIETLGIDLFPKIRES